MEKMTDLNKLDGITENLLERIRKSGESRVASLSDEGSNHGIFDYNDNLKPSKSILKKGKSPAKEGRKVSMNASTMAWEVATDYASPIKPVYKHDADYLPNTSDNELVQVANEIGKVSNDGESGVSKNPNPSHNVNANATDFEKDVAITVNTASDKVLNSFAYVLKHKVNRVAKIMELRNDECVEGTAVTIPLAAIEEVTSRFENTLYGYFVGKRLAYQVVENNVKNVWSKYGLKRIQLHGEFFLFQFENKEGMNRVLDYGAWLIRRVPLLLNIWSPNSNLHKAEIKNVPGRSAYARALIKILVEDVLKEDLVIAIPVGKDKGHSLASIRTEYEWRPPRCSTCLIFDHTDDKCPKLSKVITPAVVTNVELNLSKDVADDGFENVAPMSTGNVASNSSVPTTTSTIGSVASATKSKVFLNNSFSALNDDEDSEWQNTQQVLRVLMRVIVMLLSYGMSYDVVAIQAFCLRIDVKDHSFSSNSKIELLLFNLNYCIGSVKKSLSHDHGNHCKNEYDGRPYSVSVKFTTTLVAKAMVFLREDLVFNSVEIE
nr:hypothetical protein [Tanacetum cinerariifolium]